MATLIVQENDEDTLTILTDILEMEGFNVKPLLGYQANVLELIAQCRPSLLIADYRLRGEDCIALCKNLKTHFPQLPVIVLSCQPEIADIYQQNGFDNYLAKPFDLDVLLNLVRNYST